MPFPGVKISVLLVSEQKLLLQVLRALLESQPDMQVVGDASSGKAAVRLAKTTRPEVVLMDLTTAGLKGGQATRWVLRSQPATKVLALTSYGHMQEVQEMLEAGATGYLSDASSAGELFEAVRHLQTGSAASVERPVPSLREESWAAVERYSQAVPSAGLTVHF